jgi:micrococcal nuclease
MAWAYTQYLKDPSIARLEQVARAGRRGLWSDKEPVAPWEWRHIKASK